MVGMLLFIGVIIGLGIVGMMGTIVIVLGILKRDWEYMTEVVIPTVISIILIIVIRFFVQAG